MEDSVELKAKLSVIVELTNLLRKENKILDIYQEITDIATDITSSERSSLFIFNKEKNQLTSKIALGMDEKISISLDKGIAGYCGQKRQRIIENDVYKNPHFNPDIDMQSGYTTSQLVAVPIIGKFDNLLGVLQVLNKQEGNYNENDADLLVIVAELAASVIEDHRIKRILKEQIDAKTQALSEANEKLNQQVISEMALNQKLMKEKELHEELLIERTKLAELGTMVGFISHQMKQPLNVMGVMSQGLREAYIAGELEREYLDEVSAAFNGSIAFLSQTIDDFRLFVKHDRQWEDFELAPTVASVVRLLAPLTKSNGVTVQCDVEKSLYVHGISNEFKQVIINLVTNAMDQFAHTATPAPLVKIIGRRDGGDVVLVIQDNGGGIPEHLLPEALFRPEVTTKGEQGTGLGLHLCRLIIEKHMHGSLAAGNAEGGAEFTIRLPDVG